MNTIHLSEIKMEIIVLLFYKLLTMAGLFFGREH